MALELGDPHAHHGNKLSSYVKSQADPPSLGTIDPRTYQLMMNKELNFIIPHSSQRPGTDESQRRLSASPGRTSRGEETRKPTPPSPTTHHHHHQPDRNSNPSLLQHPTSSVYPRADAGSGTHSSRSQLNESERTSPDISDSPLDFSTKRHKLERKSSRPLIQELDSPCSRLRNILSMKSPSLTEDLVGTVLNLSKESGHNSLGSGQGWNSNASRGSSTNNSESSSPTTMDIQSFSPASSTPPSIPAHASQSQHPVSISTNLINSMAFSPYGIFSPNMSPIMTQAIPNSGLSLTFDQNPSIFSHVAATASAGSPTLPFGTTVPLSQNNSASNGSSKTRVTRPFKAYPKDPMTFPTMGLYGLPHGTPPGNTETLIHQQSNHAYAEFRKQMLNQSQSRSKRLGQKNCPTGPLSDSTTSSTNPLNYGLGMIEPGATSSGAEEYLSTSDDGYCSLAKNRLIKSDEQMKDEAYWERRRKNNEAAKRSRDARRAKEDEIAIRASFLEQENLKLRFEVCALKSETAKLRCMLYKSQ